jgi:hypothetical protein
LQQVLLIFDFKHKVCMPLRLQAPPERLTSFSRAGIEPLSFIYAQMAKLVDALVSGTSVSNDVQVRVLFWAQKEAQSAEQRAWSKSDLH